MMQMTPRDSHSRQFAAIQSSRNRTRAEQCDGRTGKLEGTTVTGVVEETLAEMIATAEQPPCMGIPDREGEFSPKKLAATLSPLFVCREN